MSGHLDDDALVALCLVDPGGPADRESDHLDGCPECSARLVSLRRVVGAARPDTGAAPLAPPPHLWSRVAEEAGVPVDPRRLRAVPSVGSAPAAPLPRSRRLLPALVAAAAVAGLVVGGGLAWLVAGGDGLPRDDGQVVADARLLPLAGAEGSGEAVLDREGATRRLDVAAHLPAASRGYYEVWLIDPADGGLVSLGALPEEEDALSRLVVPADVDVAAFSTVDVSLEPADGDPGHSGRSVLRGTLGSRT